MRREEYRIWLDGKISARPIADSVSRCLRIEKCLQLDLDDEYAKDGGKNIMNHLHYSIDDEKLNRPAPTGIDFEPGSNTREGLSSLRSAVKKYFEFCRLSIKS